MNPLRCPALILALLSVVVNVRSERLGGEDRFDNGWVPGHWDGSPFAGGGCQTPYYDQLFDVLDGRLMVQTFSPGGTPRRAGLRWATNTASYPSDWMVQVDGAVQDTIYTTPGLPPVDFGWVSLWLVIHDSVSSCRYLKVLLDNFRYPGGPVPADKYLAFYTDNGPARGRVQLATAAATIRVRWVAAEAHFYVEYDLDGAGGGWNWVTLSTFDVGYTGANWDLSQNSRFVVLLRAETSGIEYVPPGKVWFDNFAAATRPQIIDQPAAQTVSEGSPVTMSVVIADDPSVAYAWRRDGQLVPNGDSADLRFAAVAAEDAGSYQVTVTNLAGATTSVPVTLTVIPDPDLPLFQQQPQSISSYVGQAVQFAVQVQSATPVSYQWLHASTNLPGRTAATLSLTGLTTADAGEYRVRVTNAAGSKLSQAAQLTVATTPPPSVSYVRFGPTMIIHWPLSATGFKAWTSDHTVGPWSEYTGSYFLYQGNRTAIQADPTQGNRFFRLQK